MVWRDLPLSCMHLLCKRARLLSAEPVPRRCSSRRLGSTKCPSSSCYRGSASVNVNASQMRQGPGGGAENHGNQSIPTSFCPSRLPMALCCLRVSSWLCLTLHEWMVDILLLLKVSLLSPDAILHVRKFSLKAQHFSSQLNAPRNQLNVPCLPFFSWAQALGPCSASGRGPSPRLSRALPKLELRSAKKDQPEPFLRQKNLSQEPATNKLKLDLRKRKKGSA